MPGKRQRPAIDKIVAMKLVALFLATSLPLAAAPDIWTYWIQPCTVEAARSTNCEAADGQLATWALEAWERASDGRIAMKTAGDKEAARLRVFWAGGNLHLYGETRPIEVNGHKGGELYILPDLGALGDRIAAAGSGDKLYRDTIVYLTCLHESGHALGLPHNQDFEDIMYSFQYGGDIVEYFARYRRKLKVREDIRRNSGLNAGDAKLLAGSR
jgi:hypothetical protein